jgi:uncharacterized protein (TIGR03437 family)
MSISRCRSPLGRSHPGPRARARAIGLTAGGATLPASPGRHNRSPRLLLLAWTLLLALAAPARSGEPGRLAYEVSQSRCTHYLRNVLHTRAGDNRGTGSPQHDDARDRIAAALAGYGLTVTLHAFEWRGGTYHNVVGILTGKTRPDEYYVVGAHYDSMSTPGADDDASGVAALLEAARVVSLHDFESSLMFIAFDLEEVGLIGSKAWVADHPAARIAGMIALDQVSFNSSGSTHNLIATCQPNAQSNPTRTAFENAVRSYSGGLTPVYGGVRATSDHASFAALTSAISVVEASWSYNTKMHTVADSVDQPEYNDYVFATRVTRSVVAYLAAQAGAIPGAASEMRLRAGGILNAANYVSGVAAPSELITLKGSGLADPSGATTVSVRDSAGASFAAELLFVSDAQINLVLPGTLAAGPATIAVVRGDGLQQSAALTIGPIAPGIFTADATGLGLAAAHAIRVTPGGAQSLQDVSDCSTGICAPVPIDFGAPDDRVVLVLYGTGIRGRSGLGGVYASVGNLQLPCQYAGPHSFYAGLDQVNIELPRTLQGLGSTQVELNVDGSSAIPVTIYLGAGD